MIIGRIDRHPHRALVLLAFVAFLLRVALVLRGGQLYWPDERRYLDARQMVAELTSGELKQPLLQLSMPDHPLFKAIAMLPATVEQYAGLNPHIPGIFLAAFSAANIALVGLIALRAGASGGEAVLAAFVAATSASFFYFSRHLVPYDMAMTFGLASVLVGMKREWSAASSWWCGALAGCTFLTYGGYWTFGATGLLIHTTQARSVADTLRRGIVGALGLATAIGVLVAVTTPLGGHLISNYATFSSGVNQGDFSEGWRLPWEYFWHAEHGMLVVWGCGALGCLLLAHRMPRTGAVALIGITAIYGGLVVTSTVMEKFVVYGRLARQLVPFFSLATAAVVWRASAALPSRLRTVTPFVIVLAALAAFNFARVYRVVFPAEFVLEGRQDPRVGHDGNELVGILTSHFYPVPEPVRLPDRFILIGRAPHPLRFLPYQYEGYKPAERAAIRSADLNMKLLLVPPE
jgi:hypothetical protein